MTMGIDIAAGEAHLRELTAVRRRIAEYFSVPDAPPPKWRETFLLDDSFYRGRRFDFPQGAAVWSPGERTIAIWRDGQLVEKLRLVVNDEAKMPALETLARAA